jgi:hypothetical protein
MEQINFVLSILLMSFSLGFFVAGLGMVFQWFMMPNMIFYPWAVLLMKASRINEVWRHITRPLGRCRYCNSTWIAIYVYKNKYIFGSLDVKVLFVIAATWFWLKIFTDYVFKDVDPNGKVEALFGFDSSILPPTPVIPMLKTYLILGTFYFMIYIGIPVLIPKIHLLLAGI